MLKKEQHRCFSGQLWSDRIWNILGYIAAELSIKATTWITDSYLPRAEVSIPLPANITAPAQRRFKLSYSTFFTFQFPWEISSTLRTVYRLEHQSMWSHQMPTGLTWSHVHWPAVHTEMPLQSNCISSQIAPNIHECFDALRWHSSKWQWPLSSPQKFV